MKQKIFDFTIFGTEFAIYTYGTFLVVAFLVGTWWARRSAQRTLGVDPERTFNVTFALLFLGIAGARLVYSFSHYAEFSLEPLKFLKIWQGGLNGIGGLTGALLWLWWWLPRHPEMRGWAFMDVLARGACVAFAVGWIAPLLAGDDFGKPTTLPWGIPVSAFEDGTPASQWGRAHTVFTELHPSQVYESLFALALFFGLALVARRTKVPGRVTAVFLMVYGVGRALLDLTRGDAGPAPLADRGFVIEGVLSWTQFLAIPLFFAGLAIWLIRRPSSHGSATH